MVANIQLLLLMPMKLQLMLVMLLIWMGMDPTDARGVCSSCSGWLTRLIILQLLRMILIISMDKVRQTVDWFSSRPSSFRLQQARWANSLPANAHDAIGQPRAT